MKKAKVVAGHPGVTVLTAHGGDRAALGAARHLTDSFLPKPPHPSPSYPLLVLANLLLLIKSFICADAPFL